MTCWQLRQLFLASDHLDTEAEEVAAHLCNCLACCDWLDDRHGQPEALTAAERNPGLGRRL